MYKTWPKNMGKVKNNGTKRVLILVWPKGN
jgi:hypothetical protein